MSRAEGKDIPLFLVELEDCFGAQHDGSSLHGNLTWADSQRFMERLAQPRPFRPFLPANRQTAGDAPAFCRRKTCGRHRLKVITPS
jgi:hypothetical protein